MLSVVGKQEHIIAFKWENTISRRSHLLPILVPGGDTKGHPLCAFPDMCEMNLVVVEVVIDNCFRRALRLLVVVDGDD